MCSISRADSAPGRIARERILRRQYAQLHDDDHTRGRGSTIGRSRPPAAATGAAAPGGAGARQRTARANAGHSSAICERAAGQPPDDGAHARTHAGRTAAGDAARRRSPRAQECSNEAAHGTGARAVTEPPWNRRPPAATHAPADDSPARKGDAATRATRDASGTAASDAADAPRARNGDAGLCADVAAAGTAARRGTLEERRETREERSERETKQRERRVVPDRFSLAVVFLSHFSPSIVLSSLYFLVHTLFDRFKSSIRFSGSISIFASFFPLNS